MTIDIRIFLVDDHAVVRRGLEALIATEDDMAVVGSVSNGNDLLAQCESAAPDVILLDLQMPQRSGLETIPEIKRLCPAAKIMILTSFSDRNIIFAAIKAGAIGYLLKDSSPDELIMAIRNTHAGIAMLSPEVALKLIAEINQPDKNTRSKLTEDPLTTREVEILKYVARGLNNIEISEALIISERTVRTHITNILSKLHLANRTQATLYALREGIAKLDDAT